MKEADDKSLVQDCLKGNLQAFELLVERYQKPVFNIALRMLNNADDAADVAQTVFLKAYENLTSYNEQFRFFSWLYKIAVNTSLTVLEQKKRIDLLGDTEVAQDSSVGEAIEASERVEKLEDAILDLRPEYRVVIILRHFHDMSYEEMSQILDIPEKTVKSRLYTARQMLKDSLMKSGLMD
jgi:RNA polymerase sigma-70 factor (ECF subfamily)